MKDLLLIAFVTFCIFVPFSGSAESNPVEIPGRESATFYIDSETGDDLQTGWSPETAWKTIKRLNQEKLVPDDTVLFRCGGLWRESLQPASGEPGRPIIYGAYGAGEKPILQSSTSRNAIDDWRPCGDNLWETVKVEPVQGQKIPVDFSASWYVHQEKPAEVKMENRRTDGENSVRLTVQTSGDASSRIQLVGPAIPAIGLQNPCLLKFRARCTKPFNIPVITVRHRGAPWTGHLQATGAATVTPDWQEFEVFLPLISPGSDGQLALYIGGAVPNDSVLDFQPISLYVASFPEGWEPLGVDVGNMIFDHGQFVGFKRWGLDELKSNGDFWHDTGKGRVVLYFEKNPAELHQSIELCLKRNVIDHGGVHDCVIRRLALRYSAAHGVGGTGAKRVVIEDCDVYFIGGGHLYTRNNRPTRYGNGIEWWCEAEDCLVQRCRLWEIYDVAFSPQGNGENQTIKNITIRDCAIWNCEQSFEYWRTGDGAVTENVVFEHNTCVDGGYGWSHRQRPDKRGTHFLSYTVTAKTDIVLRNNIFCRGANDLISMFSDWRNGMRLYNNLWWQPDDEVFLSFGGQKVFNAGEFSQYLDEYGIEKSSILAEPKFVDPAKRDYRLAPDSPGQSTATDGGPVGRRNL